MNTGRRITSNAAYLGILTISNYLLGLLIFPYLSRVLSLDAFGLVGFSMSFVVVFQVIVEYGFMIVATAQIAQRKEDIRGIGNIVSTTMAAKLILSILALLAFSIVAATVPMVREHVVIVGLFMMSAVVTALTPDFYFRGVERMRSIAVRAVVSKLFALLLILFLVRGDGELALVPLALLCGNSLAVTLGFWAIFRTGVRLPKPRLRETLHSLRDGIGFFASRAAASANQASGAFLLGLQFAPASVAMAEFAGASKISSAGELAVIPISDAIYPHMVRTRDYRTFWKVYFGGLIAWLLGCATVFVFAEQLCVWILGPSFASAGGLLRILTIGVFIAYSSNLFGYVALTPLGLARHANFALICGAAVTVIGGLILLATSAVSPMSISILLVLSQLSIFLYRSSIFLVHRMKTVS